MPAPWPRPYGHAPSVPTLFTGAGIDELVIQFKGLEPRTHAGFLIGVAAEMCVMTSRGRQDVVLQFVLAGAFELDVIAIVRTIVGDHRHKGAFLHVLAADFLDLVIDDQIGYPFAL